MDLTNLEVVRELLARHGQRPKHRLGQNFLINRSVLDDIVDAVESGPDDLVIEVGPGLGVLTTALAPSAGRLLAIEVDRGMLSILRETLAPHPQAKVLYADVLDVNLAEIIAQERLGGQVHVAANLPYYITTPIVMSLLEARLPLTNIVVMVQKEVADRMVAPPGGRDRGALSVAVQYYTRPEIVAQVSPDSFFPPPDVKSAVLKLVVRPEPPVDADREVLFRVVKAAFGQRRKTLNNALGALGMDKAKLSEILSTAGIDGSRRGETLSLEEFAAIARQLPDETHGTVPR